MAPCGVAGDLAVGHVPGPNETTTRSGFQTVTIGGPRRSVDAIEAGGRRRGPVADSFTGPVASAAVCISPPRPRGQPPGPSPAHTLPRCPPPASSQARKRVPVESPTTAMRGAASGVVVVTAKAAATPGPRTALRLRAWRRATLRGGARVLVVVAQGQGGRAWWAERADAPGAHRAMNATNIGHASRRGHGTAAGQTATDRLLDES